MRACQASGDAGGDVTLRDVDVRTVLKPFDNSGKDQHGTGLEMPMLIRTDGVTAAVRGRVSPSTVMWIAVVLLLCFGAVYLGIWWVQQKGWPFPPPQHRTVPQPLGVDQGFAYAGLPRPVAYPNPIIVLTNAGYFSGYDPVRKNPAWVSYHVFRVTATTAPPRPSKFLADPRTGNVTHPEDYTNSGYDRGHLAPNYAIAVCYGPTAQKETFYMSNIIPQSPGLNREFWRRLEETEIRQYAASFESIWVVTGPVYGADNPRLKNGTVIPSACYRIMLDEMESRPRVLAFVVPQTVSGKEPPTQFLVSVRQVQQLTGLDFFWQLEDALEQTLEVAAATNVW